MNAEELMLLAGTARGTDFKRVAGNANKDRGPSVNRRRRGEEELKEANGRPIYDTVIGHQTRVTRAPAWSVAELGQALAGAPRLPTLAALYSVAGDRSPATYWDLYRGLVREADFLQRRYQWPHQVIGKDGFSRLYIPEMALLVLDEHQHESIFNENLGLHAAYMHVEEPVWRYRIFERFELLRVRFLSWRDTALALAQRKLSLRDPIDEEIAMLMHGVTE